MLSKQAVPTQSVIHRSDQHLAGAYTTFGYRKDGRRDHVNDLAPEQLCKPEPVQCTQPHPINEAMARSLQWRNVRIGPEPKSAEPEPERSPTLHRRDLQDRQPQEQMPTRQKSFLDGLIDRLSMDSADGNGAYKRLALADYQRSAPGQAFQREVNALAMAELHKEQQQSVSQRQDAMQAVEPIHKPHVMRL